MSEPRRSTSPATGSTPPPTTRPTTPPPAALAGALLAAVEAENAAIYGYSLAGARLASAHDRLAALGDYDVHRAQLQAVAGWAADRGLTPPPPAAVYALPTATVSDAAAASGLLAQVEESTAARYADLVAVATGSLQRAAALALQAAAVREARWRGGCVAFPGLVGRLPGL